MLASTWVDTSGTLGPACGFTVSEATVMPGRPASEAEAGQWHQCWRGVWSELPLLEVAGGYLILVLCLSAAVQLASTDHQALETVSLGQEVTVPAIPCFQWPCQPAVNAHTR